MTTAQAMSGRWLEIAIPASALVLALISVWGLCYQLPFMWLICPQSMGVMFIRQANSAFDSLGAAHYPDIAVAALYFPVVGWLVIRASRQGQVSRAVQNIVLWHLVALFAAVAFWKYRNAVWSVQLGN